MMLLLILILLTLLLGLAGLYVAERISLPTATEDRQENRHVALTSDFAVGELERVRFSTSLRGYRMSEVDAVMGHLEDRIRRQERELNELRAGHGDAQQLL